MIYAVLECAKVFLQKRYNNHTININSDSLTAHLVLNSKVNVLFSWGPSVTFELSGSEGQSCSKKVQAGITDNDYADELA